MPHVARALVALAVCSALFAEDAPRQLNPQDPRDAVAIYEAAQGARLLHAAGRDPGLALGVIQANASTSATALGRPYPPAPKATP